VVVGYEPPPGELVGNRWEGRRLSAGAEGTGRCGWVTPFFFLGGGG
jgi:hypothetical protein